MVDLVNLRRTAREIFDETLTRLNVAVAVRNAVQIKDSHLKIVETTFDLETQTDVYAVAIGKAARPMANALQEILGERLTAGVISAPVQMQIVIDASSDENVERDVLTDNRWRAFSGGHPLPDSESLKAAQAAFELMRRADEQRAPVIFLISGGGSAMIEWPRDNQTTLEELQAANRALVFCGASIAEINAVRRAFSDIKGGGLAARAPSSPQVSLIISDTSNGRESDVASGPTIAPEADAIDASSIIARYQLEQKLPASILRAVNQPAQPTFETSPALRKHYVLLDNARALEAAAEAARRRGLVVEIARDVVEQPIEKGCSLLLSKLADLRRRHSDKSIVCLISGGEFACPVRGEGTGGRNSESALRWAIELDAPCHSNLAHTVALSAGTDGIDGNSPAAGAIADAMSVERARSLGLDAQRFLEESDAYSFFNVLGDAILTGATETNVRDLRIMLAG